MTRSRSKRVRAIGLIAAGVAATASAVAIPTMASTALADDEAGSGLGSYNLAASAPVEQVRFTDGDKCGGAAGTTGGCEGVVPETVSMLRNGPIAYALSSIAWPGVLAGNIGSIIIVAKGPPEAKALNDPVRAEARNGTGPDTVTNTQYPGMTMSATAKDDFVAATAEIAQSQQSQAGNFNNTTSHTQVSVTGPTTAIAEAYSHADDISLAGGLVTIGSVTSTAKGTTDGVRASATGHTVVKDMKIDGVPVTVDEHGVTVNGNNTPLNKIATDTVNTAISQAGMTIAVSLPSGKPDRGNIVYNAGSLVFAWTTPGGSFMAILGGATVNLAAVQGSGFSLNLGDTGSVTPEQPAAAFIPGRPGTPGTPGTPPVTGSAQPPALAPQTVTPVLAAQQLPLPKAPSPVYAVLGLLGVGLLAVGMRQLPDRVLEARATHCLLGETP
jgi:hypothetical protein